MLDLAARQQLARLFQRIDYRVVGIAFLAIRFQDTLARKQRYVIVIDTGFIDGERHFEPVVEPQYIVILTMAWCNMHKARTRFIGDEIASKDIHPKIVAFVPKGMSTDQLRRIDNHV